MPAASDVENELRAPLARFHGERPPAPAWFTDAIAHEPERGVVQVEGAAIELLAWGERGRPGLMFLHGGRANADWFSFIAPFFAAEHRVAAISLSGTGRSDWRERYAVDQHARELVAGAQAAGLFEAAEQPVFVGHSFGSRPTLSTATRNDVRLRAAVILDSAISPPDAPDLPMPATRPSHVYPSLEAAIARFRVEPVQPCENLFLIDHIARHSIKAVDGGWSWRFDPFGLDRLEGGVRAGADLALRRAQCPLAFVWGEQSKIMSRLNLPYTRSIAPPGTVFSTVPGAGHHLFLDQPMAVVAALRALLAAWAR